MSSLPSTPSADALRQNVVCTPEDTNSVAHKLGENTLKASGWALIAGDIALCAAKYMEGNRNGFGGVALWLAGGAAAGIFGNPKMEKKLQLLERRLGSYLKKQGVEIPQNPTTAELGKDDGLIAHIESFLYAHPSELLNTAFAVGGGLVLRGGLKTNTPMNTVSGALVTAGALAGLLIPEKKPDTNHPAEGALDKAWQWAREKPLRVSSAFYMANDIPLFLEARRRDKMGEKSAIARYITVASYIFGNVMLWLSSKDNLGAKNEAKNRQMLEELAETSAHVVAAQPKETQEALMAHVAGYLSAQPEIKKTAPEIAAMLHEKLAGIGQSASTAKTWQGRALATALPSTSLPSL